MLYDWFVAWHPITQALIANLFTWLLSALGVVPVFLAARANRRLLDSTPSTA